MIETENFDSVCLTLNWTSSQSEYSPTWMRNFCAVIKRGKKNSSSEEEFLNTEFLFLICLWETLLIRSLETVFILVDTETHISENFLILVLHQNKGNLELQKKILYPFDRKEFWIYFYSVVKCYKEWSDW